MAAIHIRILSKQVYRSSFHHQPHTVKKLHATATPPLLSSSSIVSSSRLLFSSSSSSSSSSLPPADSSSGGSNDDAIPTPSIPSSSTSDDDGSDGSSNSNYSHGSSERPFRILGLQQVAIGSLNKGPLLHLWTNIFGLAKIGSYTNIRENVDEDILLLGGDHGGDGCNGGSSSMKNITTEVEIDLMIPLNPNMAPKVHVPPLNHIGLWVDDLPTAVHWMTNRGVRFTSGGIRRGASGYDVTFIHPKGNDEHPIGGENVLIELVQAPPHVIEAFTTTTTTATTGTK